MKNRLFLDIETAGDPWSGRLLRVGWALNGGPVHIQPDGEFYAHLSNPDTIKVSHSAYDARWFLLSGVEVKGDWHDTMVMAYVLNENTPLDLDWLAWRYGEIDMDKRLRRTGGRVVFRSDDGKDYDLDDFDAWPIYAVAEFDSYTYRDVDALRELYWTLDERLEENGWRDWWLDEEVPYTMVLRRMEARGLPVDLDATKVFAEELEAKLADARAKLLRDGGLPPSFNLNSQPQMVAYLFGLHVALKDRLHVGVDAAACVKACIDGDHEDCYEEPGTEDYDYHVVDMLPQGFVIDHVGREYIDGHWSFPGRGLAETPHTVNKQTGEVSKLPSVSSPELLYHHASDPWVFELTQGYRKMEKLLTTYLRRFPEQAHDGRLYGRFNQTGTVTGRLSSSEPNLQNQPARGELGKRTRALFHGDLVVGDYDQLEMRLMAHFSEDPRLTAVFREGKDPHLITAQAIFGDGIDPHGEERGIGKTLNFAIGYGAGPKKVAQVLSLAGYPTTKDVAEGYLKELTGFYRKFYRWKQRVMDKAKDRGYVLTIAGRKRRLKGAFKDTANWKAVSYGERQAVNAVIQGSAADILRRVMVTTDGFEGVALLAQVHDELIWEYDSVDLPDLRALQRLAEEGHGFDLRVPLTFEPQFVTSWAEKGEGSLDLFAEIEEEEE